MAIEGFDYKTFAESIAEQAEPLAPPDMDTKDKDYLVKTMMNFIMLSGEALDNDEQLSLNAEQAVTVCQIIAEWTFHKIVDLSRSDIDSEYWDAILQKIAFTIFEICKQGMKKKLSQDELVQVFEYHVVKEYKEAVKELRKRKCITDEVMKQALEQSNIDKMAKDAEESKNEKSEEKEDFDYSDFETSDADEPIKENYFKEKLSAMWSCKENRIMICVLLLLLSFGGKLYFHKPSAELLTNAILVLYLIPAFTILTKKYGKASDLITIVLIPIVILIGTIVMLLLHYNHAGWYLTSSIILFVYCFKLLADKDIENQLNKLEEVKSKIQELINPDNMYERLGVDIISLQVGRDLLSIADPDQDGLLLANVATLRQRLTDDYGYIIPNVRIMDSSAIEANEYLISIRGNVVERGFVYPKKYMVIANDWHKKHDDTPEDVIVAVDSISKKQAYWMSEETANENESDIKFIDVTDVIINHLCECAIKYVDEILTDMDVEKYIKLVEDFNPLQINYLMEYLTIYDIRRIFVNLIREKVSIKDICFVFMKLCEFVKYTTEIEALSERLRVTLARTICLPLIDSSGVLYALKFSSSVEEFLLNSTKTTEFGTMFNLEPQQIQEIVEKVAIKLIETERNMNCKPVILVEPKLRAALYKLLVRHFPTITVLSFSELVTDIKVELLDTIE